MPSRRWTRQSNSRRSRRTSGTSGFCAARLSSGRSTSPRRKKQFQKVLASDPENAAALNYLGYMLADQNVETRRSVGYIKRAVDLDPTNGAYLDSLGWAYFRLGKYELAERQSAEGFAKNQYRSHGSRPLGRSVPEDRTPETGRDELGGARSPSGTARWRRMWIRRTRHGYRRN